MRGRSRTFLGIKGDRIGLLHLAVLLGLLLPSGNAAASEKSGEVRKPPRGDICAETPPFVAMEMLAVPIIEDGYVRGILNVKPCFATNAEQEVPVTNLLPVLQDSYVRRLHRYASTRIDPEGPLDLRGLRAALQEQADHVLNSVPGEPVQVLVTFVAVRRMG